MKGTPDPPYIHTYARVVLFSYIHVHAQTRARTLAHACRTAAASGTTAEDSRLSNLEGQRSSVSTPDPRVGALPKPLPSDKQRRYIHHFGYYSPDELLLASVRSGFLCRTL